MALGVVGRLMRRHKPSAHKRGAILRKFAKKLGFVYFGVVDQHQDDHEVIRGLTVSTSHKDDHYAVGSFDGYDVSLVDRFDMVIDQSGKASEHSWVIIQVTLEQSTRLPHIFMKPHNHAQDAYAKFFSAFNFLKPVNNLFHQTHSHEFNARYEVYANSSHAQDIEQVLTPEATNTIAARLWPHAIEIFEGKLYLYTAQTTLNETLLETCLESAIWLAQTLDKTEEN